jgi:opacity protein-like surface antigen
MEELMTKLKLIGAAAVLATALATPVMAQEVVQEPGMVGFNYPNSNYMTGGYGQRTPWNRDRIPRMPYGGYVAVETAPAAGVVVGPGGVAVVPGPSPYDAYAYDPY